VSNGKGNFFMRKVLLLAVVALMSSRCNNVEPLEAPRCSVNATVVDLTGLDGCGWVFELEDGTRLEPLRVFWCGTPPISEEQMKDPLNDFVFLDGKKVTIDYELVENAVSICMVGPTAKITCLSEARQLLDE
jgi:hypothetical protein